ncbi:STXA protein, partial [Polypterus senegalus]|nr:STXA protein [Polypterus senegalus]
MEIAALGRPFQLGMLYDSRKDSLIPAMSLWDLESLKQDIAAQCQRNSEFHIIASDSLEDKSSALNVEASLKASFLGGLVEVEGSAKYLKDNKTSKRQARVTLQYKTTTQFTQLTMNHLGRGNVQHPYVFEQGIATHVVTGILYGAQAFFLFDQETSHDESMQDIQGNLQVMIRKIPFISIEGEGSLKMTDAERANIQKFTCQFYGDVALDSNPVSYEEAIKVYASLPQKIGPNGEHAIPMRVWLYPLILLDSKAAQIVRHISVGLVNQSQSILDEFSEIEMRCNDLMKDAAAIQFPDVQNKIRYFKKKCLEYKMIFQRNLTEILPAIRGGGKQETVLADLLKFKEESPFSYFRLSSWLDDKDKELSCLTGYMQKLKDIKMTSSEAELNREVLNQTSKYVVCFTFTSLKNKESYISTLKEFLSQPLMESGPHSVSSEILTNQEEKPWFSMHSVAEKMIQKAKLYSEVAAANKNNPDTAFIVASSENGSYPGASVYLYEQGIKKNENLQLPSIPGVPVVCEVTHESVTLKMSHPEAGCESVVHYRIEYTIEGQDEWSSVDTSEKEDEFMVQGLSPNSVYVFRSRAVCIFGTTSPSNETGKVQTLPTSPPSQLSTITIDSNEIAARWEKPNVIGSEVNIQNYMIQYKKQRDLNNDQTKWTEVAENSTEGVIRGLNPQTEYVIRVLADCRDKGRSAPSSELVVSTLDECKNISEKIRRQSKLVSKGPPDIYTIPLKESFVDKDGNCKKCKFGKGHTKSQKTIMVLGATGAGKTTLINGMINYILGVKWEDGHRFKLIDEGSSKSQAESQTSTITAYEINYQDGFSIPYSITIIDTPGFGDTRGIKRDQLITEHIREFFSSSDGIDAIDAVCFVTQASLARLTHAQKYVFDAILSIFGKDIAENIQLLVTFADGQKPPVLEAISVSGVPCPKGKNGIPIHFMFNNSALFADNSLSKNASSDKDEESEDDDNFDKMFWKMGTKSLKQFFDSVIKLETKSLRLTREVLKERKHLEAAVQGLQPQIQIGLSKMDQIQKLRQVLEKHEAEISTNKNYEIEFDINKPVQIQITTPGEFITNCANCHFTCHHPCSIADDREKHGCAAMNSDGLCNVCPGKCV